MSKRVRSLLIASIAVLVLAALLITLLLLPPKSDNNDGTDEPDTTVTLVTKAEDVKVSAVTVTAVGSSYTIQPNGDGDLVVKGFEDLPRNDTAITSLTSALTALNATRTIAESPEDPTAFGLDTGSLTSVSVTYSDKTEFSCEFGSASPSGEGQYARVKGEDTIYLVSSETYVTLIADPTTYLSLSPVTIPEAEKDDDSLVLRDVALSGTVRQAPISFRLLGSTGTELDTITSSYLVEKPYTHAADGDSDFVATSTYSGFVASSVAKVYPTAADLAAYGLSNPYSVCNFSLAIRHEETSKDTDGKETTEISYYNVFNYTVSLGKTDENGNYYTTVRSENSLIPLVYLVSPSAVSWATAQYEDIADRMLFFRNITDVKSLSVTTDGVTTNFTLTHKADDDDSDTNLTVEAGGKTYSTADFRNLYSALMTVYRTATTTDNPTGTPSLTVTVRPISESDITEAKLYPYTASRYMAVQKNGERYLVDAKSVESLLIKYRKFLNGESVPNE